MNPKTKLLINLIKQKKTCNEICEELNISNKQLYSYLTVLQNKGILLKKHIMTLVIFFIVNFVI